MPSDQADLDDLAALGPFFEVRLAYGPDGWRPVRDLLDPGVTGGRVEHVRRLLTELSGTDVDARVAASTLSLGLFARLVSPVLGAASLGVTLPRPSLDDTWWRPVERGPWGLALTGDAVDPDLPTLLDDVVRPITELLDERFSLSTQVSWGNVASAVFGSVAMIGSARPDLAPAARELGSSLLSGPLQGTGTLGDRFVRSSCCLYYRIPGGGYCGDCVLAHR